MAKIIKLRTQPNLTFSSFSIFSILLMNIVALMVLPPGAERILPDE
jgi:hypothetical protein